MKKFNKNIVGALVVVVILVAGFFAMKMWTVKNEQREMNKSEYTKHAYVCKTGSEVKGIIKDGVNQHLGSQGLEQLPSAGVTVCTYEDATNLQAIVTTSDCTATTCNNAVVALLTVSESGQSMRILAKYPTSEMYGSGVLGAVKEWTSRSVTFTRNGMLPDGGCDEAALKSLDFATRTITIDLATGKQHIDETCFQRSCTDVTLLCK